MIRVAIIADNPKFVAPQRIRRVLERMKRHDLVDSILIIPLHLEIGHLADKINVINLVRL